MKRACCGEVPHIKEPGSYPFPADGTLTVLEAISLAGGYTRFASVNGTRVIKTMPDGTKKVIDPNLSEVMKGKRKDMELEPDDVVMVPERFF